MTDLTLIVVCAFVLCLLVLALAQRLGKRLIK
jgi:hypothetical protein